MALFFDVTWFDERLADRGLSRAVLAAVSGISEADLALVFKDQRELSAEQVGKFAELLGVSAEEVADRAGVSTPVPRGGAALEARIAELERRLSRLEGDVARLKAC